MAARVRPGSGAPQRDQGAAEPELRGPATVVGVRDPEGDREVLAQAMDLAARLDGELIVVHVDEFPVAAAGLPASGMAGPPALPIAVGETQLVDLPPDNSWLHELCERVGTESGLNDVRWTCRREQGEPGQVLSELAERADAYCIVVGSRGEGLWATLARMMRPSVSRSVLRERKVPVLVVGSGAVET